MRFVSRPVMCSLDIPSILKGANRGGIIMLTFFVATAATDINQPGNDYAIHSEACIDNTCPDTFVATGDAHI